MIAAARDVGVARDPSGLIILTPWSSPEEVWNGTWYSWFNAAQSDIALDAAVTADENMDVIWTSRDRGSMIDRSRLGSVAPSMPFLARLSDAIWPGVHAEVCECCLMCRGRLGDCALRNALTRARAACGTAAVGCRRAGAGYFACLAEMCTGSVYVFFFDELWSFGSRCGWTDACRGC